MDTVTPIIDHALAEGWIWIKQLGSGIPEAAAVCLVSAKTLDRIADAMAENIAHSCWEGDAARHSEWQGQSQWDVVVELGKIDRSIVSVAQEQAGAVAAARSTVCDTQNNLRLAKVTAEKLYNTGLFLAAQSCEIAAAKQATSTVHSALTALAGSTKLHTKILSGLNSSLALLLTQLRDCRQTRFGTSPAGDLQLVNTLRNAASALRVNQSELMEQSASAYINTHWLLEPAEVVAGVARRVWQTHGRCTAAFNSQLEICELRRAEVIQQLRQAVEQRAATLAAIATRFAATDEEALWLAYTLDIG